MNTDEKFVPTDADGKPNPTERALNEVGADECPESPATADVLVKKNLGEGAEKENGSAEKTAAINADDIKTNHGYLMFFVNV